jgi:choloylglycine hydrolase
MKNILVLLAFTFFVLSSGSEACSSFMLERGDTLLVGHNLDEYMPVPGLIVVNPRGASKHGLGWSTFNPLAPVSPAFKWVSKYGSVTYSNMGKEFPDGGMNETGLYVGEMSYWFTEYPKDKGLVRLYHHQWVQYLLDNFETVDQVLADLPRVVPDGHCRWQFFIADSSGSAATITFVKGKAMINTGDSLPIKALCNRRYAREMDTLRLYRGFGGEREVDFADTVDDRRFVRAAEMLRAQDRKVAAADYAFAILRRLDWGNNKWSLAFDLRKRMLRFDTDLSRQVKTLDLASLDFSPGAPAMVFDLNTDMAGNVAGQLRLYSEALQREYVAMMWDGIEAGFIGNLMFKPLMKKRMVSSIRRFEPAK